MSQNMTMDQARQLANKARKFIEEHKQTIAELTKAGEAFAAPLAIGLLEGRLAKDGSGHIDVGGVPVMLLLGGVGAGAAASGYLDDYGAHAGNMAAGLLGSYGGDLGRQIGLTMRAKAGQPVQMGLLPPAKVVEIKAYAASKGVALIEAPLAGARVGYTDQALPSQFVTIGAQPQPLTAAQLDQMVRDAGATP